MPPQLPTSNVGGNNQTGPGLSKMGAPSAPLPFSSHGGAPTQNPYFSPMPGATPQANGMAHLPGAAGASPAGTGSLYDPSTSPGYDGKSNIDKQLTDMYGKGVGGMLDNILKGMGGTDSEIFKQWLASMKPVEASERAGLQGTLASEGVSGNSSVSAIANSNLTAQFNAQAAGVDSQLMQTQLQDTIGILEGAKGDAAKEVASSGWGVFADVMNNITGDVGNLMGGSYKSSGSNYGGAGTAEAPTGMTNSAPFAAVEQGAGPDPGGSFSGDWMGPDQVDASIFDSNPDVQFEF